MCSYYIFMIICIMYMQICMYIYIYVLYTNIHIGMYNVYIFLFITCIDIRTYIHKYDYKSIVNPSQIKHISFILNSL